MKRQRQYIFVTGVIFVAQVSLFSIFFFNQGDAKILTLEKELLHRKNKILTAELEQFEEQKSSHKGDRGIASIGSNTESSQVDLSNFYFVQSNEALAKKDTKKALEFLDKITNSAYDADTLAKAQYKRIQILCNKKLESDCIQEIDNIISQFPETRWAGESLLLLSRFYHDLNKHQEAKQILEIVKKDFKKYSDLKLDVSKSSKKQL